MLVGTIFYKIAVLPKLFSESPEGSPNVEEATQAGQAIYDDFRGTVVRIIDGICLALHSDFFGPCLTCIHVKHLAFQHWYIPLSIRKESWLFLWIMLDLSLLRATKLLTL